MPNSSRDISRSPCVIGNCLDIIGDRWTLLVVRDLMFFGKHEYKEFLASPESIATNILADRLKRLLCAGIINEQLHPENKSRKLYYLTSQGKSLLPMLIEMIKWGEKYLPEVEMMKPLFKKVKTNPDLFNRNILDKLDEWERIYLEN